jgi:N4-gp56 family major capsid protein
MAYGYGSAHSDSANLTTYIVRKMLSILRTKLDRFDPRATETDIPVRAGHKVARWILPIDIGVYTTAITEFGSANEVATLTWSTYEATVSTYGAISKISDMADATWLPQAKNKISDVFAYSAAKTIETLHFNNAKTTTKFMVGGQAVSNTGTLAATDTMKAHDIATVGGYLDTIDAEGFDELGGDFVLVIHGEPAQDLQTHVEPGGATTGVKLAWADIQKNTVPGQRKLERYEIGVYAGVSVQKSNLLDTVVLTNTITAYRNIGMSKDFIGKCNLDMKNFRIVEIPANTQDKSDPLGLYGVIGWKARLGHRLLDGTRGIVLYTAK